MKILHIMAGSAAGGAENAFVELVAAQKAAGFDVRAACRPNPRNALLRDAGVTLTELPFGGVFDFRTTPALRALIRETRPAVLVSWMNRAAKKLPRNTGTAWVARLGGYYDLKYYRGVDRFVVNAPDIGRWMTDQGIPAEKIAFIPNFAEIPARAEPVPRVDLQTPDDAFVVLTLARLHPNKAIDTLLRAFAGTPSRAVLWIAGEGPERAKLETLSRDLGVAERVRFLGWREDRWNLLAACDAFVLPSRHEPFGNAFMQAWAAARPLVTTATAGPAYYARDGENALVVPIDDVPALAAALTHL
ncbi:MAG: glycosyltransferase, partial [Rhodospirillales bacterium]|nr:glycosyltransferase [Rhodospirillales bacterium]